MKQDKLLDELIAAEQTGHKRPPIDELAPGEADLARRLAKEAQAVHLDSQFSRQLEAQLQALAQPQRRKWTFPGALLAAILALILVGGLLLVRSMKQDDTAIHSTSIGNVEPNPVGLPQQPSERMGKIAFSPDHTILAQGGCSQPAGANCLEGQVRFWDVENQQLLDQTVTIGSSVTGLAYSPDGQWLAITGCAHNTEEGYCDQSQIWLWSPASGQVEKQLPEPSETVISQVHFDGTGKIVLATSIDGTLWIWDWEQQKVSTHSFFQYQTDLTTAAFSADGKMMVFQDQNRTFWFWNIDQGQIIGQSISGQEDQAPAMALHPVNYMLVSADQEGSAWAWSWSPIGELVKTQFACHFDVTTVIAFSPKFGRLVSGGEDGTVCELGFTASGEGYGNPIQSESKSPVVGLAFSADVARLAAVHLDNTIVVWDSSNPPNFRRIATLEK